MLGLLAGAAEVEKCTAAAAFAEFVALAVVDIEAVVVVVAVVAVVAAVDDGGDSVDGTLAASYAAAGSSDVAEVWAAEELHHFRRTAKRTDRWQDKRPEIDSDLRFQQREAAVETAAAFDAAEVTLFDGSPPRMSASAAAALAFAASESAELASSLSQAEQPHHP